MSIDGQGLNKTTALLIYGLMQFQMGEEDMEMIVTFLEEDDQVLMIHYLATHPDATQQDILKETARLLKQRKRLEEQ